MSENNTFSDVQLRFDVLKFARELLHEESSFNRDNIVWVWDSTVRNCLQYNKEIPDHPGFLDHPTDDDILETAKKFTDFVYNQ